MVNQAQQAGKVMLDSVPVDGNMLQPVSDHDAAGEGYDESGGERSSAAGAAAAAHICCGARYASCCFAPGLHVLLSYNEVPDELELKIMGALM